MGTYVPRLAKELSVIVQAQNNRLGGGNAAVDGLLERRRRCVTTEQPGSVEPHNVAVEVDQAIYTQPLQFGLENFAMSVLHPQSVGEASVEVSAVSLHRECCAVGRRGALSPEKVELRSSTEA